MRTNKAISVLLLTLCMVLFAANAHAVRLSVGSVVVPRDETNVTVPLSLSEMEGVVGYSVVVRYDPRYLAVTDIRGIGDAADFSVVINIDSPGTARLTGLALDLEGLPSGSGAFAEIDIEVIDVGNLPQSSYVSIVSAEVYDTEAHSVAIEPEPGKISRQFSSPYRRRFR